MRSLLLLGLIAGMAAIAVSLSANWGSRLRGDALILNKNITAFAKPGKYQDRLVKYDPLMFRKVITAIYVKDNFRNASGAEVHLVHGGVGVKYATIRLHSQYSQGINSSVLIYGV